MEAMTASLGDMMFENTQVAANATGCFAPMVHTINVPYLDAYSTRELQSEFESLKSAAGDLTLDMKNIEFLDSAGLGSLTALRKHLRERGDKLRLLNVKGQPKQLLATVRWSA